MLVPIEQVEPGSLVEIEGKRAIFGGGQMQTNTKAFYPWLMDAGDEMANVFLRDNNPKKELEVINTTKSFVEKRRSLFLDGQTYSFSRGYSSGCDPEIFVLRGNREIFPAREFLKNKKVDPSAFYDGIQAEFCPSPAACLETHCNYILSRLSDVVYHAKSKDPKSKLTLQSAIKLSKEQLRDLSDEDLAFRCSTSLNIYDDIGVQPEPREYPWRFAGGHIHVGCGAKTAAIIKSIVKSLDGILGVAAVSMAANFDNPERRRMYGRAGEFRLPKHGLEYRVLSNYWLAHPLIYHLTFELMRFAVSLGEQGLFQVVWDGSEEEIRDIINWSDVVGARKMLDRNKAVIVRLLENRGKYLWIKKPFIIPRMLETIWNGLEIVAKNPGDIEGNWGLRGNVIPGAMQWSLLER